MSTATNNSNELNITIEQQDVKLETTNVSSVEDIVDVAEVDSEDDKHPLLKSFAFGKRMDIVFGSVLGKSLFDLLQPVVFGGAIFHEQVKAAKIRLVPDSKADDQAETDLGTLFNPNVARILELTKPSSFGKNGDTVYDEKVHKGLELVADQFTIDGEDSLLDGLRYKLKDNLFLCSYDAITFKRYKMAVYQEGGHFQFHRDTLHADNHQATLLIEVKSAHEGGNFVVDPYCDAPGTATNSAHLFELEFDKKANNLKWVAFFTDTLHKVEPVTAGTRIVIQYDVYINPGEALKGDKTKAKKSYEDLDGRLFLDDSTPIDKHTIGVKTSPSGLNTTLALLEEKLVSTKNINVAIPLFHQYSAASIKPDLLNPTDRALFEAIAKTGKYELGLSPITISGESDNEGCWDKKTYSATLTQPLTMNYRWSASSNSLKGKPINKTHHFNSRRCKYIVSMREDSVPLEVKEFIEYTGNEAETGSFKYFLGVMVVGRK